MTCLYKTIVKDMIHAFMQIANYMSWLKGGSIGEGPNFASSKLKVITKSGDLKLLVDAMKSCPGVEDLDP